MMHEFSDSRQLRDAYFVRTGQILLMAPSREQRKKNDERTGPILMMRAHSQISTYTKSLLASNVFKSSLDWTELCLQRASQRHEGSSQCLCCTALKIPQTSQQAAYV